MKKNLLMLLGVAVMFFACQNETVTEEQEQEAQVTEESMEDEIIAPEGNEDTTLEFTDESENLVAPTMDLSLEMSSQSKTGGPKAIKVCKVKDVERCDFSSGYKANFWWAGGLSTTGNWANEFFGSDDNNQLTLTEYDNGTANLTGSTVLGDCAVEVNVWFVDKRDYNAFVADGGEFKDEPNDCTNIVPEDQHYYVIDATRSTVTSAGTSCLAEGTYGLRQRPDPNDPNTPDLGVIVGPGAALFDDSDDTAYGLSTWGWLTDLSTGEDLWIIDFNFLLECEEVEECKECKGGVNKLTLEFDWCRSKRVRVYQKKPNSCRAAKIFDKVLAPHEEFTICGINNDSFGRYIYIKIGHCYYTKINTNCWTKIGPGYEKGVFNVVSGTSTQGGELCDYVKPDNKCYRHWFCKYYSKCRYW